MEPDSTERENEEWTHVQEQQAFEQAEESQNICMQEMHDGRKVGSWKDP